MPTSPPSSKNHRLKRIKFLFDSSNNNPFDISNIKFKNNPLFPPLLNCKSINLINNNNPSLSNKNKNKKKLNKSDDDYFKKKMDTILEKIRQEREDNTKKNIIHKRYKNFVKTLDDISNNNNNNNSDNNNQMLELKGIKKSKDGLDLLLDKINAKYNLIEKKSESFHPKLIKDKPLSSSKYHVPNGIFGTTPLYGPSSYGKFMPNPPPLLHHSILSVPEENSRLLPPPPKIIRKVTIDREINNLEDILKLIKDFPLADDVEYNINMKSVHRIKEPLYELNSMVGMKELKNNIVDQIIYFMQDLHLSKTKDQDFMHTVIYGPPGTGKTEIAKIIGKIFCNMGLLKRNIFKKATRSDLIAGYLGQTAIKTRDMMRDCLGGVLFIDEAYALGNPEKRDSFAKECIDTLCEGLSDNKSQLMVIIAGYEEDLKKCFFAYNQGLDSRFPWRFKTDDYDAADLNLIFQKKIKDAGWSLQDTLEDMWFEKNIDYFKYYGRDMETLFSKTKIAHSRRVFCKKKELKTKIIKADLEKGFEMFLDNNEVKARKDNDDMSGFMYM